MRVSAEAIYDGVGQGWFIDVVIPLGSRKLRRDYDGFPLVAVLEDMQQRKRKPPINKSSFIGGLRLGCGCIWICDIPLRTVRGAC